MQGARWVRTYSWNRKALVCLPAEECMCVSVFPASAFSTTISSYSCPTVHICACVCVWAWLIEWHSEREEGCQKHRCFSSLYSPCMLTLMGRAVTPFFHWSHTLTRMTTHTHTHAGHGSEHIFRTMDSVCQWNTLWTDLRLHYRVVTYLDCSSGCMQPHVHLFSTADCGCWANFSKRNPKMKTLTKSLSVEVGSLSPWLTGLISITAT